MITTTANRVKQAGYWCADANKVTTELVTAVGGDWDTEIPLTDILTHAGLSSTVLALGVPRPRYMASARHALTKYCGVLFQEIEIGLALAYAVDMPLTREKRISNRPDNASRRRFASEKWLKHKFNAALPEQTLLCEAVLIMLSEYPTHIKAVHAGKNLLSAAQLLAPDCSLLEALTYELRKLLSE